MNNRRIAFKVIVITGILCISSSMQAADPLPRAKPEEVGMSSERLALIGKAVNAEIERERLPGAVLAIARRDKLIYFETFGYLDKTAGKAMLPDAIFNIASMTKPMTAVAALQLYERGKLLMEEPLSKYFPKFANAQVAILDAKRENIVERVAATRSITIQDLFRHTSGLTYGGRGTTPVHKMYPASSSAAGAEMTGSEFMDRVGSIPLLYQPGTVWDYSLSIDVLGLVVEQITERSLGQYLQDNVWKPLGMTDTQFFIPVDKASRYAKALPIDPEGRPQNVLPILTQQLKFECGGACASSTATDYLRFAQMLMRNGRYGDARILGRKTVEYMLSNHLGTETRNLVGGTVPYLADYGFGLSVAVRTTPGIARMAGSVGDFSWPGASGTNWWADPREELVVVWMTHTPGTGPIRTNLRQMINALVYQAIVE
jgi:CubicO group peptidase (beta-lactamase class C family)